MTLLIFFLVSLLASVLGAVCGVGGGVVIKPVLDALGLADAAAVSFLSGCTVLAMSGYTTARSALSKERIHWPTVIPLAIGAAVGGVAGKQLFQALAGDLRTAGRVQAIALAALMTATLLYLLCKKSIKTHTFRHPVPCVLLGAALGLFSSFLGIGGGPINLVVLFYFFSMDTKAAAQSSLAVILFSQLAALGTTLLTHSVPAFRPEILALMVAGGFLGGETGRRLRRKLSPAAVERLLIALTVLIIGISLFSAMR